MTYLQLIIFLELFTIRSRKEYDYGLIVRCRKFILSIYDECMYSICMSVRPESLIDFIDYAYTCALTLPNDEFLFIRAFRRYSQSLLKFFLTHNK